MPFPESNYNNSIDSIVDLFEPLIANYIKENLQKILKTVLEARFPPSDKLCKKLLKAKSSDIYCNKSHIEYYNFYQQCKNYFIIARAKIPNHILFATFFLCDCINIRW